jgi:hypothetical protein
MSDTPPILRPSEQPLPDTLDELRAEVHALRALLFRVVSYGSRTAQVEAWRDQQRDFVERGFPSVQPLSDIAKRGQVIELDILEDLTHHLGSFGR